jgi:hypothetical protein
MLFLNRGSDGQLYSHWIGRRRSNGHQLVADVDADGTPGNASAAADAAE